MPRPAGIGSVKPVNWAYDRAPMIIYWELTTACALACRHCRATAQPEPAPGELSTSEALALLDDITRFGTPAPHVIMTGGDPMRRGDLDELIRGANDRGLGVSLAPAVTPLLSKQRMAEMKALNVQAMSLSLDGSVAEHHDGVRQVPGTFDATLAALAQANEVGIPVQINTLITDQTVHDLDAMYELLTHYEIMQWSLFFLISVGRGAQLTEMSPGDAERTLIEWGQRAHDAPFRIKTTEAMQYRRITAQRLLRAGKTREEIENSKASRGFGIRDGNGIVFVSHLGEVMPSGFLPTSVGNVRERSLVELYRDTELMKALRRPEEFKGSCGVCEFNRWCGGSRARAAAWTGDPLESDPLCPYVPRSMRGHDRREPSLV
ncbi:radical SAM protein, BA_1875 family [Propionibacterium cyclohexanicum]|uniref:Radical SAM protein, BA_1875 family n=1 Tax=Propionibacterium cyclohexanicum TaxID=64702 RepID=A0A1H9SWI1_9ACTN|nr:TIGR04053 family radical SAM/SPASM domain-containing protein [Propionibacterium cyclohexanicum]SER88739.1 radical SAM protein, BA_1875 family [Propionibacterium cyclohexanicum]